MESRSAACRKAGKLLAHRKRISKREQFLDTRTELLPWNDWVARPEPHCYHNRVVRPPIAAETMPRMCLLQRWFSLSGEGLEDAIYDSSRLAASWAPISLTGRRRTRRRFASSALLLAENRMGEKIFEDVKERLERAGLMMHGGTIVDSTTVDAPSSTKNKEGKRDPEMHQAKKGSQRRFGMSETHRR